MAANIFLDWQLLQTKLKSTQSSAGLIEAKSVDDDLRDRFVEYVQPVRSGITKDDHIAPEKQQPHLPDASKLLFKNGPKGLPEMLNSEQISFILIGTSEVS